MPAPTRITTLSRFFVNLTLLFSLVLPVSPATAIDPISDSDDTAPSDPLPNDSGDPDISSFASDPWARVGYLVPRTSGEPNNGMSSQPPAILQQVPKLDLRISSSPGTAATGDLVTIKVDLANTGDAAAIGITYADALEGGLAFDRAGSPAATYDAKNRIVSIAVPNLDPGERVAFDYTLRVIGQPSADHTNGELWTHVASAIASDGTSASATLSLWVGGPQELSDATVGKVSPGVWTRAGPASLRVPAAAASGSKAAVVRPVSIPDGPPTQFEISFLDIGTAPGKPEFNIETPVEVKEAASSTFSMPVDLAISLDGVADVNHIPADQVAFVVTYDEKAKVWVKVPIDSTDYRTNELIFRTKHFSTWGVGLGDSLPHNGANVLLFDDSHVSIFTGQARFSYPIWTPPGRGGMAPSLSLDYASGTVNGVLGDIQAPWVGMGWSMEGIEIVRKITTDENGYGYEDAFTLALNGISYQLVQDPVDPARYHTKDASFLYIERHSPALGNLGEGITNQTHEWWEVAATDGTRYYLGRTADSEQRALMDGYSCTVGIPCLTPNGAYSTLGYAGTGVDFVALRWRVDEIVDTLGNFETYEYAEEGEQASFPDFDRASYIEAIHYTGFDDGGGGQDLDPAFTVLFVAGDRQGDNPQGETHVWDNYDSKLLDKIQICYGDCDTGIVIRTYDLGYSYHTVPSADGTLVLDSIRAYSDGLTDPFNSEVTVPSTVAPDVTFEYDDLANWKEEDQAAEKWPYPRLAEVRNGYGGSLAYTYDHDSRGDNYWYNYAVRRSLTSDGLGVASIQRYAYDAADAVYEGVGQDEIAGAIIGYKVVILRSFDFDDNTVLTSQKYSFDTEEPNIGKTLSQEWLDPNAEASTLRKTTNTWITDNSQVPAGVDFVYLGYTYSYELIDTSLTLTTRTRFVRDPATGNLSEQRTYLGNTLVRRTEYEYETNTDPEVWILDKQSRVSIWDRYDQQLSDSRSYFDEGDLTKGELTFSQSATGDDGHSVDTTYTYDGYGNVTEVCTYASEGGMGLIPIGGCGTADADELTTRIYDGSIYTFVYRVTNRVSDELIISTYTDYFIPMGLPYQTTDPNGYVTSYAYDGLGRLTASTAPGFTEPTTVFTYPAPNPSTGQVSAPHAVQEQIWDTLGPDIGPSGGIYRSVWSINDGLGRVLQTQVAEGANQLVVTDMAYDALGRVVRQGVGRSISGSGGTLASRIWGSITYTESAFDTLGRPISIVAPGDLETQYIHDGLVTSTIDPNGHKTSQEVDGLGRLVKVREYTGADPSWVPYATTSYTYDALDRLSYVLDDHENRTGMSYDWLGRKASMDDPDMGHWEYVYDVFGNLVEQTDGRGQTISFAYDVLNRLTSKDDVDSSTNIASFAYDQGTGSIGQRTHMVDGSGVTTWSYDLQGDTRTVTETYLYDPGPGGLNLEYEFSQTSDWLGRTSQVIYPDNETVTYSYDSLGRPAGIDGEDAGQDLVKLAYNAQGQITASSLGNGIVVQNCYSSDTLRLAARRAYELDGPPKPCTLSNPPDTLINFQYAYDPGRNITTLEDKVRGETFTFSYDSLDRLTQAEGTGTTEIAYRQQYHYDEIGNIISIDSWNSGRAQPGTYEEDYVGYWFDSDWQFGEVSGASGGSLASADSTGDAVRLAFNGAGLNYVRMVGPDQGIAQLFLDGALLAEVDNYTASSTQQAVASFAIAGGDHLLEVRVSGEKNPLSTGTSVSLDAIEVLETGPTPTPTLTPSDTNTPTLTPTPSDTPSPTPTPSLTPTPDSLVIAVVGQVTNLTDNAQTVTLGHTFNNPVVIAQPPSVAGADTSVVRISDVQGDRFTLRVHEAPNKNGDHSANETVSYLVIEQGSWQLPDGTILQAGKVDTSDVVGSRVTNVWETVTFEYGFPDTLPAVVSQVQTSADGHWVKTRTQRISAAGFDVALEEEENSASGHGTETIGWVAIEPASGTWSGHPYEAGTTTETVTNSWYTLSFSESFSEAPLVVAGMATYNDDDNAGMRRGSADSSSIQLMIEEDTTRDSETTHAAEAVSFLAVESAGTLSAGYFTGGEGGEGTLTATATLIPASEGTYEEDALVFRYEGSWESHENASYSSGKAIIAHAVGDFVSFQFTGSSLTYYRKIANDRGIAQICVDGTEQEDCTDIDNYSASTAWIQPFSLPVPYGDHEVTIRYSGRKHPDSLGYLISLDKLTLSGTGPTDTPTPTPTATVTATATSTVDLTNVPPTGTGLQGDYYNNSDFTSFALSRVDAGVNFNWGSGSPDPSIGADTFSVRWQGWVQPQFTETYTFYTNTDDGARLWVNGVQLVDRWVNQGTTEYHGSVALTAGVLYPVVFEYYENGGGAVAQLKWSSASVSKAIVPSGYLYPGASATPTATFTSSPTYTATPNQFPTAVSQTPQAPGTYENTSSAWHYSGTWTLVSSSLDSGNSRQVASSEFASAQLTFTGDSFRFYFRKASYYGISEIWVDGFKWASVDQYASSDQGKQNLTFNVGPGTHVVEIRRPGRKNENASSVDINLDRIDVFNMPTPTATITPTRTATGTQPTATSSPTATPTPPYRRVEVGDNWMALAPSGWPYVYNQAYEVEDGEDRVLLVSVAYGAQGGQSLGTPTVDSATSMTKLEDCYASGDLSSVTYYLLDPSVGSHTVRFGFNVGAKFIFSIITLYNVDLDQFPRSAICEQGLGSHSVQVTTQPGDLVIDLLHAENGHPVTVGADQTDMWVLGSGGSTWNMKAAQSYEVATDTQVTMSYSARSTDHTSYIVAVVPVLQSWSPTSTPSVSATPTPTGSPTPTTPPGWTSANYSYESSHPHAVVSVERYAETDEFGYDAMGNMITRDQGGSSWNQPFTAEGRMEGITNQGTSDSWDFIYNGDGTRVGQDNPDGTTTLFIAGGSYEVVIDSQGQEISVRKYYAIGGQRVMREDDSNYYLLTDHLGSVVGVADEAGSLISEQRYMPYGLPRLETGIDETDFGFTGQRSLAPVHLMDYGARWYSSGIGAFSQADPLFSLGYPGAGGYAYASGNPLTFVDPSGLYVDEGCGIGGPHSCDIEKPPPVYTTDPDYDPDTGGIDDWGDQGLDQSKRLEMAKKVLDWLCESGGWWGTGCPSNTDIAVWLLQHEGGLMLNDDVYGSGNGKFGVQIMVEYIESVFWSADSVTPENLSEFTSFFNPERDRAFDAQDWLELSTSPDRVAFRELDRFWRGTPNPEPHKNNVGGYVTEWWNDWEPRSLPVFHRVFDPHTGATILNFGP